jgi:hypothetical protein
MLAGASHTRNKQEIDRWNLVIKMPIVNTIFPQNSHPYIGGMEETVLERHKNNIWHSQYSREKSVQQYHKKKLYITQRGLTVSLHHSMEVCCGPATYSAC